MKVLVIDGDDETVNSVSLCFSLGWLDVVFITTSEGAAGIDLVEVESPDLVLLEPDLPDVDGFDALGQIRSFSDVPLIILTNWIAEDR